MINQVIILGKLVQDPILEKTKNGRKVCNITLAVPRSYKNDKGIYETDFIPCTLLNTIAEKVTEYCNKGDSISVKGRLQKLSSYNKLQLIVEKVTFVANHKKEEK